MPDAVPPSGIIKVPVSTGSDGPCIVEWVKVENDGYFVVSATQIRRGA